MFNKKTIASCEIWTSEKMPIALVRSKITRNTLFTIKRELVKTGEKVEVQNDNVRGYVEIGEIVDQLEQFKAYSAMLVIEEK